MTWGNSHDVETSFYRFDVSWLRESTVRELLVHVLAEKNSNLCFGRCIGNFRVVYMWNASCERGKPMPWNLPMRLGSCVHNARGDGGYIRNISLRAICANTTMDAGGGKLDHIMLSMYSVVLPIFDICKSNGAKTIVGRQARHGRAVQERMEQTRRREALAASA